jgi:hypothetical protein
MVQKSTAHGTIMFCSILQETRLTCRFPCKNLLTFIFTLADSAKLSRQIIPLKLGYKLTLRSPSWQTHSSWLKINAFDNMQYLQILKYVNKFFNVSIWWSTIQYLSGQVVFSKVVLFLVDMKLKKLLQRHSFRMGGKLIYLVFTINSLLISSVLIIFGCSFVFYYTSQKIG